VIDNWPIIMKKFLVILSLLFASSVRLFGQEADDQDEGNEKIRDKMSEFIQKRLDLSKAEAEKFTPVFIRYFKEWRQTLRENKADDLVRRQKIIDLQLRYRNEFREIVGDKRGDQVFEHQRKFIEEMVRIRRERMGNNPVRPPARRRVNKLF
jgi:hypothetical protein